MVEESVYIIFDEFDNFNPTKQVDDFALGLARPNEKHAYLIEDEEGIKEEKNEEEEENLQNNTVPVTQDDETIPVSTKNKNIEGTDSTIAERGTNEQGSSSSQEIQEEQPVPIREFQPKP